MDVTVITALLAGFLTFFAPCTLPLVPGYLAYLGGIAEGVDEKERSRRIFRNALWFVAGFGAVFILFGAVTGAVGNVLIEYRSLIMRVGGVLVVIFGLSMLGIFHIPSIQPLSSWRPPFLVPGRARGSFLLGAVFATGWSPCLGPILGSILVIASTQGSAISGAYLLLWYAVGLGIPFLMLALAFRNAFRIVGRLVRFLPALNMIGGAIFVLIGILMIIGKFGLLTELTAGIFDPTTFTWFYERV
jgi:cytochrome c-type biogenesis protein